MATKPGLPVKIIAYGGMLLVRKTHPTMPTAKRFSRVIKSWFVIFTCDCPVGGGGNSR
jgi:hypothetical protein